MKLYVKFSLYCFAVLIILTISFLIWNFLLLCPEYEPVNRNWCPSGFSCLDRSYLTEHGFRFVIRNDMDSDILISDDIEVDESCIDARLISINNITQFPVLVKSEEKARLEVYCEELKHMRIMHGFCRVPSQCRLSTTIKYTMNNTIYSDTMNSILSACSFKEN